MRTLRTSSIVSIVHRLVPLFHIDPVAKLPIELVIEIFSYLDVKTLLTASRTSKAWRERAFDTSLWRQLFVEEGWGYNWSEVLDFEKRRFNKGEPQSRKLKTRLTDSDIGQPHPKKRVLPRLVGSHTTSSFGDVEPPWDEQHGAVEADLMSFTQTSQSTATEDSQAMEGLSFESYQSRPHSSERTTELVWSRQGLVLGANGFGYSMPDLNFVQNSLYSRLLNGALKLNWIYLFKQRRKLEENWENGKYTNFQLPHPSCPWEAHQEGVYAIQFSGKWLVSGSRDKTVRVWDLATQRLRGRPLLGHEKSVLCLQFDPSKEEDIIISGGSDKHILIWRFSTGEKLHSLIDAHDDSVLNLRFNKQYLVSCSKDKLIKVWNRHEINIESPHYPKVQPNMGVKYPPYIINPSSVPPAIRMVYEQEPLQPYSLLMTLDGHSAAVNAIQIDDNEIVSASGDRLIKTWDIHSGVCLKTVVGHQKGIACVQFDSRRIISGSNDQTVRIFDHATGAEVASLRGHRSLVRTVQADFRDPPDADEKLCQEVRAIEGQYYEALERGEVSDPDNSSASHARVSQSRRDGSRHPADVTVLGAKIPPGGGGGSWARIVSGSYDTAIIIWKKDHRGHWIIGQQLRFEEAIRALAEQELAFSRRQAIEASSAVHTPDTGASVPRTGTYRSMSLEPRPHSVASQLSRTPRPVLSPAQTQMQEAQAVQTRAQAYHQLPAPAQAQVRAQMQAQMQQQALTGTDLPQGAAAHGLNFNGLHGAPTPAMNTLMRRQMTSAQVLPPQAPTRVFKLQFDARKLICASHDHRIVGWDFACGDNELERASRFFMAP